MVTNNDRATLGVAVAVGVRVGIAVLVGVGVREGVTVLVRVGVRDGVTVGVAVFVGTGTVALRLGEVKPFGKKQMAAADWARGARLETGHRFGQN